MALNPTASFPTKTLTPSPQYPYGAARDVVVAGDRTGTPWVADLLNDIWGFQQEILQRAGITPSGSPDEVGASEYMGAMKLLFSHPGEIITWIGEGKSMVADYGARVLSMAGQGVLRSLYTELDDAVYVGDALNPTAPQFYHADDAAGTSRNTTGAYLILPDISGCFLRNEDVSGTWDPDGFLAGRYIGSKQQWVIRRHSHHVWHSGLGRVPTGIFYSGLTPGGTTTMLDRLDSGAEGTSDLEAETIPTSGSYQFPVSADYQSDYEVRPLNIQVRFYLRY